MSEPADSDTVRPAGEPLQPELTAILHELGAVVLAAETVETIIDLVTTLAVATIPGTTGAGVTLVDARGTRTLAASDVLVEQADALQYQLDAGPCLSAWRDQVTVRIDDAATEARWPQWCGAAVELGVRAVISVPLTVGGTSIGAIKVYSAQPDAYSEHDEHLLSLFARQAAILLVNTQTLADARQLSANLTVALANRDVIGQAKGVLIAQGAADEQAAFAMLVSVSQRTQVKLHDVARQLVQSAMDRQAAGPSPSG